MKITKSKRPFVGLRSFESHENDIFFGREKLIGSMLDKLSEHRFLSVTGVSGGGKSSLVKTGLVNGLRRNLIVEAGALWTIIDIRPNNRPIYSLSEALLNEIPKEKRFENDIEFLTSRFKRNPKSFTAFLIENRRFFEGSLLIIIDQFEEIFRYEDENDTVSDIKYNNVMVLVDILIHSSNQKELLIYNIITIRADYLGDCASFHGLPELINKSQFIIPRLTRDELHDAISLPVRMHDGEIEPILVNRILNDLGHNLEQLPQMQHALMRIWNKAKKENKKNPKLTLKLYENNGGLGESISTHADEIYNSLDHIEQELCEKIYKFITRINSHGRKVRRPQSVNDISYAIGIKIEEIELLTDKFRQEDVSFLRPNKKYRLKDNIILDITHESIMRQWRRLRDWMDEESLSKANFEKLKVASEYYQYGKGALLIEPDLSRIVAWREEENPSKGWANRYGDDFDAVIGFLDRSLSEEKRKEDESKKRIKRIKEAKQRRKKRKNYFFIVMALLSFGFSYNEYRFLQKEKELIVERLNREKDNHARKLAEEEKEQTKNRLKLELINKEKLALEKDKLALELANKKEEESKNKLALELSNKEKEEVKNKLALELANKKNKEAEYKLAKELRNKKINSVRLKIEKYKNELQQRIKYKSDIEEIKSGCTILDGENKLKVDNDIKKIKESNKRIAKFKKFLKKEKKFMFEYREDKLVKEIEDILIPEVKYTSFKSAIVSSKNRDKIIMMFVQGTGCVARVNFESYLEKSARVKKIMNRYFSIVKINKNEEDIPESVVRKNMEGKFEPLNSTVIKLPTILFMKPSKSNSIVFLEIPKIVGERELYNILEEAIRDGKNLGYLKR